MPVYKGKRRANEWRVIVRFKNLRREWTVNGQKKDAEAFERKKQLEFRTEFQSRRAVPIFSDFSTKEYAKHAGLKLKKGSTLKNRKYVIAQLGTCFGDKRLDDITPAMVEAYAHARVAEGMRESTVNMEIRVLKTVLSYARSQEILIPARKFIYLPERGQRKVHAWTAEELTRLFSATTRLYPDLMPILVFLANTGCRKGEAIALEWENVDLENRIITIWPGREWQPKSNKAREVPINDELTRWLAALPRLGRFVFVPSGDQPSQTVGEKKIQAIKLLAAREMSFTEIAKRVGVSFDTARSHATGVPRRVRIVRDDRYAFWPQRKFDQCRKAAELKGGPHTFRHSYATEFLANGGSMFDLSKILGHSHERTTALYSHLLPERLKANRDRVSFSPTVGAAENEALRRWGKK